MTETALWNLGAWSVQVALLTLAAGVLARIIPIDSPTARYAWWRAVLVVALALPVIQPWQPPVMLPVEVVQTEVPNVPSTLETIVSAAAVTPPLVAAGGAAPGWPAIIGTILLAGALLRLAWLAAGLVRLRQTRRAGVPANRADAPDMLHDLIEAGADVRQVSTLRQPVTFGLVRPVVLLPGAFASLPIEVQRAVLAHELWHVKRRDWLWSLGEEALRSLFWFHPAIAYLVTNVQGAREEVVDELSILSTNSRRSYLEALLAFADEPAVYPAAPFIRRRQLFNRMMLISREGVMSPRRIVASIAAMAGALVMAGWYGTLAFPLTDTTLAPAGNDAVQGQAQPRDPKPSVARPATSREEVVKAATVNDPSDVKKWLELAKLQEDRGAYAVAVGLLQPHRPVREDDGDP
jgi:beta-lactamase regulating signal transducer with metallopeptidase domain